LVRISENQESQFCLVYLSAEKIEHRIVKPDTYAKEGFLSYVRTEVKKYKLTPCSLNNKHYEKITKTLTPLPSVSPVEGDSNNDGEV